MCHCKIIQWETPFGSVFARQRAASLQSSPCWQRGLLSIPTSDPIEGKCGDNCAGNTVSSSNVTVMSLGTQGHIGNVSQCQLPLKYWSNQCTTLSPKESNVAVIRYYKYMAKGSVNKQYHRDLLAGYFSFWDLCHTHRHEGSQESAICLLLIYFYNCACQQWAKLLEKKFKVAMRSLSFRKILPDKKFYIS